MDKKRFEKASENIKSALTDRKSVTGVVLFTIGVVVMYLTPQELPKTIDAAINHALMMVASYIFLFTGVLGAIYKSCTKRLLKWVDFLWMVAAALGVVVALMKGFQIGPDMERVTLTANLASVRSRLMVEIDDQFYAHCRIKADFDQRTCSTLASIYESLRKQETHISDATVSAICPYPLTAPIPLWNVCVSLASLKYLPGTQSMEDKANVDARNAQLGLLVPMIVSLLLGLRFAKSALELFWLGGERKEAAPASQTINPTAGRE